MGSEGWHGRVLVLKDLFSPFSLQAALEQQPPLSTPSPVEFRTTEMDNPTKNQLNLHDLDPKLWSSDLVQCSVLLAARTAASARKPCIQTCLPRGEEGPCVEYMGWICLVPVLLSSCPRVKTVQLPLVTGPSTRKSPCGGIIAKV